MTLISKAWIRTISTQEGTKYTFCGALEYRYKHIAANWNDETRRKYEREFNDIILPALDNHNGKCIDEYTREDYENAIDYIRERSFERNGLKRHYAESTIRHFQNLIYYVVFQSAVYGLCENVLWGTSFVINIPDEQEELESRVRIKKSLSVNQEKQLYQELFSDPNEDGALVALMLMWGLGLRNGEACGMDYCDIKPIEGHPDCYAAWIYKSTKIESNELQSGGKTYNTGRIVPVPDKILAFLEKRKEIIRKLAFGQSKSEVNVDELPICNAGWLDYDSDSYLIRCKADDVTVAANSAFENAGITSEQVAVLDAELSEGKTALVLREKDPSAYLLRRNFATQMCILGLDNAEMQYLLGHCVEDAYESRNEFVDSERIYSMYRKLQNRTILNNPKENDNEFKIRIRNNSTVKISATAAEPADNVRISVAADDSKTVQTKWFEYSKKVTLGRTVNILEQYKTGYQ
ncbi:MAG: site-specific integrase [Clostridiales bacterium]|nr:site-specific integrase [Clostridiales bacterium]